MPSCSPDPRREDIKRDLNMRGLTVATIEALQRRLKSPVRFIAAVHDDHTDKRHVHVIALVNRPLYKEDCRVLIGAASSASIMQRRALDREVALVFRYTRGRGQFREAGKKFKSHASLAQAVTPGETPVCPNAGLMPHWVRLTKRGTYWCLSCKESLREQQLKLSLQDDLELERKLH